MDEKRFNDVYQYLVEETENTLTLHDRKKNELLKMLLELFEYLRDQEEENPVIAWFAGEEAARALSTSNDVIATLLFKNE